MLSNTRGKELLSTTYLCFSIWPKSPQSLHLSFSPQEKTPIEHSGGEEEWMGIFFVLLSPFHFAEILKHPPQQGQECRWVLSLLLGSRESLFISLSLFLFSITTWKKNSNSFLRGAEMLFVMSC